MEYATVVASQRVVRGGAAPFAMFKGCGVSLDEEQAERYYGPKGSALHHL